MATNETTNNESKIPDYVLSTVWGIRDGLIETAKRIQENAGTKFLGHVGTFFDIGTSLIKDGDPAKVTFDVAFSTLGAEAGAATARLFTKNPYIIGAGAFVGGVSVSIGFEATDAFDHTKEWALSIDPFSNKVDLIDKSTNKIVESRSLTSVLEAKPKDSIITTTDSTGKKQHLVMQQGGSLQADTVKALALDKGTSVQIVAKSDGKLDAITVVGTNKTALKTELAKVKTLSDYRQSDVYLGEGISLTSAEKLEVAKLLGEKISTVKVKSANSTDADLYVKRADFSKLSNTKDQVVFENSETLNTGTQDVVIAKESSKVTIDGVTHTAGAIAEAYEIAEKSLIEFAETYKSSINMLSISLSTALTKTFAELGALVASGQPINSTKIMQKFALNAGISLVTQGLSQTEIAENLSKELDLKLGEGYGDAVTLALIDFGIDAAINSSDWDSNDWVRNGATTVSAYVTPVLLKNNFGISGAEASGITAGVTTFISGVIANPDMNHEEWTNLTVQAGIAGISAFAGIKIGAAIGSVVPGLGTLAGAVVGAVIGTVMSKVFGNITGAIHLNPGETQTLNAAEDQLWKFAKLGIKETDSNGVEKTVLKDAIYVTNADGVMLNKQAMLDSRSVFRVFNGTVSTNTTKENFKPIYLLGGKAADNIIGNDDSEVIYGYDGSDFLDGRGGNNSIFAGGGNDVILAASGRDFIDAGEGDDFVEVEGGNNVIILGKGDDKLYAGGGNDVINAGEGSDVIQAGHGDNIIILGNPTLADDGAIISDTDISRNEVYAGYGRDNITGSSGRDIIVGDYLDNKGVSDLNTLGDAQVRALGYMNDTIRAGDGSDLVMGGLGQDTIYGGKGNDILIGGSDLADYSILNFTASDVDFIYGEAGDDRLKLKTQGANDNSKKHKLQNVA